jgi:hypothetical protein
MLLAPPAAKPGLQILAAAENDPTANADVTTEDQDQAVTSIFEAFDTDNDGVLCHVEYAEFCGVTEGTACDKKRYASHCKALGSTTDVGLALSHLRRLYAEEDFERHYGRTKVDLQKVRESEKPVDFRKLPYHESFPTDLLPVMQEAQSSENRPAVPCSSDSNPNAPFPIPNESSGSADKAGGSKPNDFRRLTSRDPDLLWSPQQRGVTPPLKIGGLLPPLETQRVRLDGRDVRFGELSLVAELGSGEYGKVCECAVYGERAGLVRTNLHYALFWAARMMLIRCRQ